MQGLHLNAVLSEDLRQLVFGGLEVERAEAVLELGLLHLVLANAGGRRGLEIMNFSQFQLICQDEVGRHLHVSDAVQVDGQLQAVSRGATTGSLASVA